MKTIVLLCVVIVSCRSFAQFKPYDPNNPNPSEVDVFNARRFADEERREAFNVGDATSLDAQRHQQNAMEAERDAHLLEDRMRANEQRRREQEKQQARLQGGVFNTLPSDLELMQELQAIAYLEANAPKIERFVKWKPWDTYSNRASARQTAKKTILKHMRHGPRNWENCIMEVIQQKRIATRRLRKLKKRLMSMLSCMRLECF